jgi:hypothetical protein
MIAKGKTGTVHVSSRAVTIYRKGSVGWRATVGASERRIPIESIRATQLKAATPFSNGCLEFVVPGHPEPSENSVAFAYRHNAAFEAIAHEVTRTLTTRRLAVVA